MVRDETTNDRTVIERVDPLVGTTLGGKYRIEFKLASGGFGAIYRARDAANREVAVKVVHARLARDPEVAARFRREGETLTALRSPHTIAAYEVGETDDGTLYIVLELLRGVSLFERFRSGGRLAWPRMVAIARAVCESLAEAHELGIVHRDLKPTNIHLERVGDDEDFVKVLDFGIAKILQSSQLESADLTTAGLMIGTIDYMSPEQMLGGEITGGTDIYTLGIVMYEMITGRRPFAEADTASAALAATLKTPPPMSSIVVVPSELDRIVMRCLARDARNRFLAAGDLRQALGHVEVPVARLTQDTAVMSTVDATAVMHSQTHELSVTPMSPTDVDATVVVDLREAAAKLRNTPPVAHRVHTVPQPQPRPSPMPPPAPPPPPPAPPPLPVPRAIVTPPPLNVSGSMPPTPSLVATLAAGRPEPVPPPRSETLRGFAVPSVPPGVSLTDATTVDRANEHRFEVDRVVARDALMRRAVWIALAVVAVIAIVLAARL